MGIVLSITKQNMEQSLLDTLYEATALHTPHLDELHKRIQEAEEKDSDKWWQKEDGTNWFNSIKQRGELAPGYSDSDFD